MESETKPAGNDTLTLSECKDLRDYARFYQVSLSTVNRLKAIGAKLEDESEINYLKGRKNLARHLQEYRASLAVGACARTQIEAAGAKRAAPAVADFTLKQSLDALRAAEAVLLAEFQIATAAARAKPLGEWLKVHEARIKAEQQIFEVEKLNSNTLPIDDVKKEWFELLQSYRQELESIPNKWSVFLFQKEQWEVETILKKLVIELKKRHLPNAE